MTKLQMRKLLRIIDTASHEWEHGVGLDCRSTQEKFKTYDDIQVEGLYLWVKSNPEVDMLIRTNNVPYMHKMMCPRDSKTLYIFDLALDKD